MLESWYKGFHEMTCFPRPFSLGFKWLGRGLRALLVPSKFCSGPHPSASSLNYWMNFNQNLTPYRDVEMFLVSIYSHRLESQLRSKCSTFLTFAKEVFPCLSRSPEKKAEQSFPGRYVCADDSRHFTLFPALFYMLSIYTQWIHQTKEIQNTFKSFHFSMMVLVSL